MKQNCRQAAYAAGHIAVWQLVLPDKYTLVTCVSRENGYNK